MYNYNEQKPFLFTEEGNKMYTKILIKVLNALQSTQLILMADILNNLNSDLWSMMACVDRLIELNLIVEITGSDVAGQNRIFKKV